MPSVTVVHSREKMVGSLNGYHHHANVSFDTFSFFHGSAAEICLSILMTEKLPCTEWIEYDPEISVIAIELVIMFSNI